MKFFIDTANLDQIREANDLGVLDGVTTNPSLMAKEGIKGVENCKNQLKDTELKAPYDGYISKKIMGEGYGRVIDSQWIIQDISLVKKTAEIRKDNGKSEGCGG